VNSLNEEKKTAPAEKEGVYFDCAQKNGKTISQEKGGRFASERRKGTGRRKAPTRSKPGPMGKKKALSGFQQREGAGRGTKKNRASREEKSQK